MATRAGRSRARRTRTRGLLVRRVPFGESDAIVTFFTEARGIVGAVARGAGRSQRRFSALEPMHELVVTIDESEGHELASLVEASIEKPRLALLSSLDSLEAAGTMLRWLRAALPQHAREPDVYALATRLFDALDAESARARAGEGDLATPPQLLAAAGLELVARLGWAIDFERCVSCGKVCAPASRAAVDGAAGGLVCRACGGARVTVSGETRARLAAASRGEALPDAVEARGAIALVEARLAHERG